MHIDNATSVTNHFKRRRGRNSAYRKRPPIHPEVDQSRSFIRTTSRWEAGNFRPKQLGRVKQYVTVSQGVQGLWNTEIPSTAQYATGKFKSLAITAKLQKLGLKEARWMTRFAYGCPWLDTTLSSEYIPRDMDGAPELPVGHIRSQSSERFFRRAIHSV